MLSPKEHKILETYIQGMDVKRLSAAFDALGEPNRCLLFRALLEKDDITVGQLATVVGISESLASQHLKILLQADLVDKSKRGNYVYYRAKHGDKMVDALQRTVGE